METAVWVQIVIYIACALQSVYIFRLFCTCLSIFAFTTHLNGIHKRARSCPCFRFGPKSPSSDGFSLSQLGHITSVFRTPFWVEFFTSTKTTHTPRMLRNWSRGLATARDVRLGLLDVKWSERWRKMSPSGALHPTKHTIKGKPFYCLSMFPYPSGILHMGHLRVYTISDVISRFKRLRGYDVIHPMGWDAFGLPAENAARERGVHPAQWTQKNIEKMKEQMGLMLADFDWDRELSTCLPDYYKWTQYLFLQLYKNGLAYRKEALINWDPVDNTVLANEQVDAQGNSWRLGAKVEKRLLEQWFIGITKYAKELNQDLETLHQWPEKVKTMQRHWIGQSEGAEVIFPTQKEGHITVYTSRPETLFSVQFVALSLTHPIVKKQAETDGDLRRFLAEMELAETDSKQGFRLSTAASIPIDFCGERKTVFDVPVYAAPYVLGDYGHGAVMGCPAHDERDSEFWKIHSEDPARYTVGPKSSEEARKMESVFTEKDGVLYDDSVLANGVSLGSYHGLSCQEAASRVVKELQKHGSGGPSTQLRIRDWLISRQRYWGAPIPIIHCQSCGTVPVPETELPVLLPENEDMDFGSGNPLEKLDSFVNTTCPSCKGPAKRDTDTMDTFMDSSWYFFRYTDPHNSQKPFGLEASKRMPVDMYVGGVEHAILHLLYLRFVAKVLGDIGMWDGKEFRNEPIKQLVTQGMVQGKTFSDPTNGRFLRPEEMDFLDPANPRILLTGALPSVSYEKMSKSKYNGADPAECIKKYGADATRAHMLFQAPISDALNWNEEQIQGVDRWLRKVIALLKNVSARVKEGPKRPENDGVEVTIVGNGTSLKAVYNETEIALFNDLNGYTARIAKAIEEDLSFNTVISDYMKMTNALFAAVKSPSYTCPELLFECYRKLLVVMAPVTPSVSEECWEVLQAAVGRHWESIFAQKYPENEAIESSFSVYKVILNGKVRGTFKAPVSMAEDCLLEEACKLDEVLFDKEKLQKVIVKKGLVSIITRK